ncbi:hypothetical protein RJI07_01740 [Mycoplasmatota bacterium WC30]
MIRVNNLKLNLDQAVDYASELANLRKLVILRYKIKQNELLTLRIFKKAIDARKKANIHFVYNIDIEVCKEKHLLSRNFKDVKETPNLIYQNIPSGKAELDYQPVIVGFGPSGIFSALILSRRGYEPIVLERGYDVSKRTKEWNKFLENREFTENSSILYGEGGAGTFSDGKLTTLIKDLRCRVVLEALVNAGAGPEILYVNKPHIGTDVLKKVIKNIREEIISNGGVIRFDSQVTDFLIENNQITGVVVNNEETIKTNICLLGIGHSARDTYELLYKKSINIQQKPFSIGVRIEHPQDLINKAQYGESKDHPSLGAADYKLSYHSKNGRSAYTFCMCPGGFVVNASSESGGIVTNGMSLNKRDNKNANSALLVNVTPKDFNSEHPLAGIEFQRRFEKLAFELAGKNYNAPVQLVEDFLNDKQSFKLGQVIPSYRPGYEFVKMTDLLPKYITDTMKEAIVSFDSKLKGFALDDAIITGPETRSSSPIRIIRDETFQSNIKGLYPMGEGAGYAGGIMSSAVDGIKVAENIISEYKKMSEM